MKRLAIALLILGVLGAAGVFGLYRYVEGTATRPGAKAEPIEFLVPKGATVLAVGGELKKAGLIEDIRVLRLWVKLHGAPAIKAGRHAVDRKMSMVEILAALAENPLPDDVPLTIVEGSRVADVDAQLAAAGWARAGEYLATVRDPSKFATSFPLPKDTLEGYLYPETYAVPMQKPLDLHRFVERQLRMFEERFAKPHADEISKSKRSLHELVTMASMLEREEPKPAQRPEVAGVLYRRIDAKTPLGVDATSRYELKDWNDRVEFLKKLRDPSDPYNTRTKAGLPPTPIGAPAIESLLAALRPVASPYWYYLHDKDKNIHFGRTAEEHEANRRKYDVW